MLTEWQNLSCKNNLIAQSDPQIECNLHQNFYYILHRTKNNPKIHTDPQESKDRINPKKREMLEAPLYLILNYYDRAIIAKQSMGSGAKPEVQTNKIEQRANQ